MKNKYAQLFDIVHFLRAVLPRKMAALFLCVRIAHRNKHLPQSEFALIRVNTYYCPCQ